MTIRIGPKVRRAVAVLFVPLLCWAPAARGQDDKAEPVGKFDGAVECRRCHTRPKADDTPSLSFVFLTEYAVWKTEDKHAQAYAVLKNQRSQNIGKLLNVKDVTLAEVGCINCHGMAALKKAAGEDFTPQDGVSCAGCHGASSQWLTAHIRASWRKKTPEEKEKLGMVNLRDPVRRAELCMSCHVGNAAEGKVVTHAMFAAGHPPLPPFEVATFSQNMPQHWRDPQDVPFFKALRALADETATGEKAREEALRKVLASTRPEKARVPLIEVRSYLRDYPTAAAARETLQSYPVAGMDTNRTRLALAGNLTAFRETMRLVADRALGTTRGPAEKIWPELLLHFPDEPDLEPPTARLAAARWAEVALAHTDCYACHHDLATPGFRQQRGFGYRLPDGTLTRLTPGRPPVRSWSLPLLGPSLSHLGKGGTDFASLTAGLEGLNQACDERPFGEPDKVGRAAQALAGWCDGVLKEARTGRPAKADLAVLLRQLAQFAADNYLDYESARQVAAVFQVAFEELKPADASAKGIQETLDKIQNDLNLKPYSGRKDRRKILRELLEKETGKKDADAVQFWEAVDNPASPDLPWKMDKNEYLGSIQEVGNEELNRDMQEEVVNKLEGVADRELDSALRKVAGYDAEQFRKRMQDIRKLLALQ
jgi:hypothetical protein